MAVSYWTLSLIRVMVGHLFNASAQEVRKKEVSNDVMNVGNWSVGDCILARFNMNFSIHTDNNGNAMQIMVPPTAIAGNDNRSHCSKVYGETQSLSLSWNEIQKNEPGEIE